MISHTCSHAGSRILAVFAACCALTASTACAHKASDSYLTLRATATNVLGEWHLALRDLEDAVGLDANDDGAITWGELRARQTEVSGYALSRLGIRADGQRAGVQLTELLVDHHSDGAYAVLRFEVSTRRNETSRFEPLNLPLTRPSGTLSSSD